MAHSKPSVDNRASSASYRQWQAPSRRRLEWPTYHASLDHSKPYSKLFLATSVIGLTNFSVFIFRKHHRLRRKKSILKIELVSPASLNCLAVNGCECLHRWLKPSNTMLATLLHYCWSTVLSECWDAKMKRFEVASRLSISNSTARQLFVYTKNCNRKCYVICGGGCTRHSWTGRKNREREHGTRLGLWYAEVGKT